MLWEKSFCTCWKTKKKDAPSVFYKSTTKNKPFFNRDEIFFIRRIVFIDNSYNYWISKRVNSKIINKRFLRQDLFPLKEKFIWKWILFLFIITILNFSDGDVLKGINFSKENDYYIMSMSSFMKCLMTLQSWNKMTILKKNQSLQIVRSEVELIIVLTHQKSKLFSTNLSIWD